MEPYKREKEIIYTSQDLFFSLQFDTKDVLFESSTEANIQVVDEKTKYLIVPMNITGTSVDKFIFLLGGKYLGEFYIIDRNKEYINPKDALAIQISNNAESIFIHIGNESETFRTYTLIANVPKYNNGINYKFNVDDLRKIIAKYFSKNPNYLKVLTQI